MVLSEQPKDSPDALRERGRQAVAHLSAAVRANAGNALAAEGGMPMDPEALRAHVAAFAESYSLLKESEPALAAEGLRHLCDALRATGGLVLLHDYQYRSDAGFYPDLLRLAGSHEDPAFAQRARVTLGGWLRRHAKDTGEAVTLLAQELPSLAGNPDLRSTAEYEMAMAQSKIGDQAAAARWMDASGRSAAEAGNVHKGRMTRGAAATMLMEADPEAARSASLSLLAELERAAAEGSPEQQEDTRRWILNMQYVLACAAEKAGDAAELRARLEAIDVPEYIQRGWITAEQIAALRDGLAALETARGGA